MNEIEVEGIDVDEAIAKALEQLDKTIDEVNVVVVEKSSNGFLGIGKKLAKVRVSIKDEVSSLVKEVLQGINIDDNFDETDSEEVKKEKIKEKKTKNIVDEVVVREKEKKFPEPEVCEEDLLEKDRIAEKAKTFLATVLEKMDLNNVMIEKLIKKDKIVLNLRGDEIGLLIGKHGQTLNSIQYLTNLAANNGNTKYQFILIDIENYRFKRKEILKRLANKLAAKVKETKAKVILEPMNPYERKIIHLTLENNVYVKTKSEGEGLDRHLVIYYNK